MLHDSVLKTLIPQLRRYSYSLTNGNLSDVDDLVQQTLEALVSKPIPPEVKLSTWAFKICSNLSIDAYRKAQREVNTEFDFDAVADPQVGQQQIEDEMLLNKVQAAMRQLSVEHRQILALLSFNGLSYQEISDVLEIPIGTVMSRVARARAQLLALLAIEE